MILTGFSRGHCAQIRASIRTFVCCYIMPLDSVYWLYCYIAGLLLVYIYYCVKCIEKLANEIPPKSWFCCESWALTHCQVICAVSICIFCFVLFPCAHGTILACVHVNDWINTQLGSVWNICPIYSYQMHIEVENTSGECMWLYATHCMKFMLWCIYVSWKYVT